MAAQIALILSMFSVIPFASSTPDHFTEELLLKPLYTEQLYAHFHFATVWSTDYQKESCKSSPHISALRQSRFSVTHSHLFPRALGEILGRHNVQELHVTLTSGLWRYERWGYPVVDAAPGAEVWAWFKPDTEDVDRNWKQLAASLSGLLCASFNFIEPVNSIAPEFSFRPRGVVNEPVNSTFLRYSSLPREIVCTENLTPWKKLLPCDSRMGLATLLNAGHVHNVRYHSVGLHVRPVCRGENCADTALELTQSVSLVYDYAEQYGARIWSFKRLFGQGLMGACPLARSSTIYVETTTNSSIPFTLDPLPLEYVTSTRGGFESTFAKYEVPDTPVSITARYSERQVFFVGLPPPIYASQYITGYGQERGGIVTKIYNRHWNSLDVVLLQNIPWFVPVYLHKLKILCNGRELEPKLVRFRPGRHHVRPYYLEILLQLPARSTTSVSIDFDYVFLKWQEYPPDANHGFYIGSAVVSAYLPLARNYTGLPQDAATVAQGFNASRSGYLVQVRTEAMVVTLPTPDFSMPYNVICLSCTVVALAFGPLHNITTKKLRLKRKDERTVLGKVVEKVLAVLKGRKREEGAGDKKEE